MLLSHRRTPQPVLGGNKCGPDDSKVMITAMNEAIQLEAPGGSDCQRQSSQHWTDHARILTLNRVHGEAFGDLRASPADGNQRLVLKPVHRSLAAVPTINEIVRYATHVHSVANNAASKRRSSFATKLGTEQPLLPPVGLQKADRLENRTMEWCRERKSPCPKHEEEFESGNHQLCASTPAYLWRLGIDTRPRSPLCGNRDRPPQAKPWKPSLTI